MISPHTPPGADVIAVLPCPAMCGLPGLKVGELYTVDRIVESDEADDRFGVVLIGHGVGRGVPPRSWRKLWRKPRERLWGYRLESFRYVDLAGLDALLDARVKEKA